MTKANPEEKSLPDSASELEHPAPHPPSAMAVAGVLLTLVLLNLCWMQLWSGEGLRRYDPRPSSGYSPKGN